MEKFDIKCPCGSRKLHLEVKGTQTGIYCDECGKWIKWASKQELRLLKSASMWSEFAKEQDDDKKSLGAQTKQNPYLADSCATACLPCTPDATLYAAKAIRTGGGKWTETIVELHIDHFVVFGLEHSVRVVCHDKDGLTYNFESEDFGDSVFLSREELQDEIDTNVRGKSQADEMEDSAPF